MPQWLAGLERAAARFRQAAAAPRQAQEAILLATLARNADCEYGRRYRFASCRSIEDYQSRVPIVSYDDIAHDIDSGILTSEPVLMVEETSGSTGAVKRIPYTAGLRREFSNALEVWMHDLYTTHPELQQGTAYWSLSPLATPGRRTAGGLPIGFEDDREYFDGELRDALDEMLTVPSSVARIADIDEQREATLRYLVADKNLAFISVWNPSYLTILWRHLDTNLTPREIWPKLSVISCWTEASASLALPELLEIFEGVEIQPKGLLSTEGVVSIPVGVPTLAVTSHFFEFRDRESGEIVTAGGPREGREYEVILTTSGGLYRYATGDIIRGCQNGVRPHFGNLGVAFVGRGDDVADIAGEKLSEPFVRSVLERERASFLFLAPDGGTPPRYLLFIESACDDLAALATRVDRSLSENPHYDYCRRVGQLGALEPVRLRRGAADAYLRLRAGSSRLGGVKPRSLETSIDWRSRLSAAGVVA